MAKGKSKNKPRKPPTEKFLVVVDPWRYRNFFEDIGVWFEIMLQEEFPGTRVDMIYAQVGKHQNVIVQLPGHVDIRPLLGAHRHANILNPPYNMNTNSVSYIFEYNFESEGQPRDWATVSPSYDTIDPDFPVRSPYPISSAVSQSRRNSKPGYAKQLPKDLWEENDVVPITTPGQTDDDITSSSIPSKAVTSPKRLEPKEVVEKSEFTSYPPPSTYSEATQPGLVGHFTFGDGVQEPLVKAKKKDPYEQADEAERLLHADRPSPPKALVKREYDPAEAFLRSILPVKEDAVPPADNYQPSSELLATFATLPAHLLRAPSSDPSPQSVVIEREANAVDGYCPSDELLATFATLPAQFLNRGEEDQKANTLVQGPTTPWIKAESCDNDRSHLRLDISSRDRSVTLGADMKTMHPPNLAVRIKDEPRNDNNLFSSNSAAISRDPRKRPQAPASGSTKKIKLEESRRPDMPPPSHSRKH